MLTRSGRGVLGHPVAGAAAFETMLRLEPARLTGWGHEPFILLRMGSVLNWGALSQNVHCRHAAESGVVACIRVTLWDTEAHL